jgi:hypothetical protein
MAPEEETATAVDSKLSTISTLGTTAARLFTTVREPLPPLRSYEPPRSGRYKRR